MTNVAEPNGAWDNLITIGQGAWSLGGGIANLAWWGIKGVGKLGYMGGSAIYNLPENCRQSEGCSKMVQKVSDTIPSWDDITSYVKSPGNSFLSAHEVSNLTNQTKLPGVNTTLSSFPEETQGAANTVKEALDQLHQSSTTSEQNISESTLKASQELVKNSMIFSYVTSLLGGAVFAGAATKAICNLQVDSSHKAIKEELPTIGLAGVGIVFIVLSQINAHSAERIPLAVATIATGILASVSVLSSHTINLNKPPAIRIA